MFAEYYNIIVEYVQQSLQNSEFAQGAVVIAILTAIWQSLKRIPAVVWPRIKRLFYYTVTVEESDEIYDYFYKWLEENYSNKFQNTLVRFSRKGRDYTSSKDNKPLFDNNNDYIYIWYNWRFLKVQCIREKLDRAEHGKAYFSKCIVSGFFVKKAINKIMHQMGVEKSVHIKVKRKPVMKIHLHDYWITGKAPLIKSFENIFCVQKNNIIETLKTFEKSESIYRKRGLKYKKGILISGSPGLGKSSMAEAIANYLKRNLYVINLPEISKEDFKSLMNGISNNSVILIDDIDICIANRDSAKEDGVDLASLLAFLDSPISIDDTIIVATTNHPEKLDPALVRRGRFDIMIKMESPTLQDYQNYINNFWDATIKLDNINNEKISNIVDLQTICLESSSLEDTLEKIK